MTAILLSEVLSLAQCGDGDPAIERRDGGAAILGEGIGIVVHYRGDIIVYPVGSGNSRAEFCKVNIQTYTHAEIKRYVRIYL